MIIILSLFTGLFCTTTIMLCYIVNSCQYKIDVYEGWIVEFKNDINDVYREIKIVDDKNIFEKDDDVGSTFSQLYSIIQKLNQRIDSNVKNKNQEEKF